MKPVKLYWAAALLLLLWFPKASQALALDAGVQPIEVTADRLRADSGGGSVMFEGNVVAVQGDVTMRSDFLRAEYSRETNTIEKVEAEGEVRFLREDKEVMAEKATLFNMERRVVFQGGAVMRQGGNTVHGETITIYLSDNQALAQGAEGGGRVKAVIFPKDIKEAAKP